MRNGQPLPDDQSDGFKLCSPVEAPKDTWYDRRIFNPNASISRRPVGPDLYIQQQNIHLGNHISTTGSKGYGPTTGTDILVERLYRRTVNTHDKKTLKGLPQESYPIPKQAL